MVADNHPTILAEIIAYKKEYVKAIQTQQPLAELKRRTADLAPARAFTDTLIAKIGKGEPGVIAEIKKASPSAGVIRADVDIKQIANSYAKAGACCLSVLTDSKFFQGADEHLMAARAACTLPILRKDFIITAYQIYQAKALGADCILLIAAILSDLQLQEFAALASELGLDVLVEVHNREELERAMVLRTPLIGINNRNLHTFETTLDTTLGLLTDVFSDRTVVTESGIHTKADVQLMRRHNVNAFLVGEALMKSASPGQALKQLFFTD